MSIWIGLKSGARSLIGDGRVGIAVKWERSGTGIDVDVEAAALVCCMRTGTGGFGGGGVKTSGVLTWNVSRSG
jgi:hypothetical protein